MRNLGPCGLLILGIVSTSFPALVAQDNLIVTDVSSPFKVSPNFTFPVTVMVEYSFSVSTRIEVDIYDYSTQQYISSASSVDHVQGTGQKSYSFSLTSPGTEEIWSLSAVAVYGPNDAHFGNWSRNLDVVVVSAIVTTSVSTSTFSTTTVTTALVTDNRSLAITGILSFILGSLVAFLILRRQIRRRYEGTRVY